MSVQNYAPIFGQAVSALSEGRLPNYANCRSEDVLEAFKSVFWENGKVSFGWLVMFQRKIADASWGVIKCQQVNPDDWPCLPVEGSVQYMKLVDFKTGEDLLFYYISASIDPIRRGRPLSDAM